MTITRLVLIAVTLMACSAAIAQTTPPMTRNERRMSPDTKSTEKSVEDLKDRKRINDAFKYTELDAHPCALLTRDELEAILKRSDNDRALVTMPKNPYRDSHPKRVRCFYSVNYENRIFPERGYDNGVSISIDFDNKNAKEGMLVVDPYAEGGYEGREYTMEVVHGLGDQALYARDKSRFKYEEKFKSTAGALPYEYYDNQESLYVRKNDLVVQFKINKIVAGGANSELVIQIARLALTRLP